MPFKAREVLDERRKARLELKECNLDEWTRRWVTTITFGIGSIRRLKTLIVSAMGAAWTDRILSDTPKAAEAH